jgi:hypothetical protein
MTLRPTEPTLPAAPVTSMGESFDMAIPIIRYKYERHIYRNVSSHWIGRAEALHESLMSDSIMFYGINSSFFLIWYIDHLSFLE